MSLHHGALQSLYCSIQPMIFWGWVIQNLLQWSCTIVIALERLS